MASLGTVCHRHGIDCLLAIGLELVAVAVTEQSLLSGSKALTVAIHSARVNSARVNSAVTNGSIHAMHSRFTPLLKGRKLRKG